MKHHLDFDMTYTLQQYTDMTEVAMEELTLEIFVRATLEESDLDYKYKIYLVGGREDISLALEFLNKEHFKEVEYAINEEASTKMAQALCEWKNEGLI